MGFHISDIMLNRMITNNRAGKYVRTMDELLDTVNSVAVGNYKENMTPEECQDFVMKYLYSLSNTIEVPKEVLSAIALTRACNPEWCTKLHPELLE